MIIDAHTHIFPPEVIRDRAQFAEHDTWFGEIYTNPKARLATADDLVAAMDANGVDAAIACSFGWRDQGLIELCNDYMIEAVRAHPGRLFGLAGAQPLEGGRAASEVDRCAAAGLSGVGEIMPHGQGYRLGDSKTMGPLMEVVTARDLPLLAHASEPVGHRYLGKGDVSAAEVQTLIQTWPEARIVAAHWGGGFPFYELMPEVRVAAQHLWYDSAASPYLYRAEVFALVAGITGGERILWATDFPLIGHQRMLDYVRSAGLDEATLARVLGRNAAALLRLPDV